MAHIADCLLDVEPDADEYDPSLGLNNYIAKALSPPDSNDSLGRASPSGEKPFAWRMQNPERKYQLFPKDRQATSAPGKPLDPEQAFAVAMAQNGDRSEKLTAVAGLRIRIKEHNLIRRRKISVPELGPMTTVQETSMDSPTIPGRPPVHERSISAPGSSWKPYYLADCMTSGRPQTPAEIPEYIPDEDLSQTQNEPRRPLSPKALAPLVIPTSNAAASRQLSLNRLRSATPPVDAPIRSARREDSPRAGTPFTPLSASLTTPRSAATTAMTTSTLPTPISAVTEHRASPRPWEKPSSSATTTDATTTELSSTPKTEISDPIQRVALGHRRHQSESGSIMERGRPRKRSETCGATMKRTGSKRSKSTEKRAFEQLPKGWKASDAVNVLSPTEVASLQQQALQQAARFEVLRKEDVDSLSRELRQLDERTEFLRHTYTTLRAGRRNLHTRICQYLRSPRTAKFSAESMLKQEEAVAELDTSIDEWVIKLEQAENRRTRVRQKLLEHVAAAATLAVPNGGVIGVSESLQHAIGVRPPNATTNLSTPPRSPVKPVFTQPHSSSPSPHRAHVPSTILEQPLFEEAAAMDDKEAEAGAALRRAETIRVYADNGVFDLLADVEDAIKRMGGGDVPPAQESSESLLSDAERTKLCRARSHEVLSGGSPARKPLPISKLAEKPSLSSISRLAEKPSSSSLSSVVAASPGPDPAPAPEALFLTSAVFKPER
ncbi:Up-regulated during septation-domain-containing protein [Staphylotrichum tortipilum]|uniref:Up-regulated during septation-domain-containing protein n=1 Tax=Staphylotrichum tortipilum TaxID=2831512 RepID=A0AAN6RXI0_9PEZI|nr:Up-regulated during septation-domain-containing protein [Staphylotrichum longicolle]